MAKAVTALSLQAAGEVSSSSNGLIDLPASMNREKATLLCDKAIEGGLLFLIIFTPLAFGTVHIWSITVMELLVAFLVILWMIKSLNIQRLKDDYLINYNRDGGGQVLLSSSRLGLVKTPLNIPILLFIALVVFQLTPLPPSALKLISPGTYQLYSETLPHAWPASELKGTEESAPEIRKSGWRRLSVYPGATKGGLLKLLSCAAVFFLVVNNLKTKRQLGRMAMTIIGVGFIISLVGILQHLSGTGKIYWFRDASYSNFFGTYVNRNHFAGYVGLALGLALGYFLTLERQPARIGFPGISEYGPQRSEEVGPKRVLLGFLIVIMMGAILLSASRGGVVSVMVALALYSFLLGIRRGPRKKGRAVPIILSFVLALVVWVGKGPSLSRLSTLFEPSIIENTRPVIWRDTMGLVGHFPILGTGLGTFRHIYPAYQTVSFPRLFNHAHNDYVELVAEMGLAGFLLAIGALGFTLAWSIRRWFRRRDPYAVGLALGAFTAVAAFLVHSLVDFNFHIPANAMAFSAVLGILVSSVHLNSRRGGSLETPPAPRPSALGRPFSIFILVVSVLSAGAVTVAFAADGFLSRGVKTLSLEDAQLAAALEPWSAEPLYQSGRVWEQRGLETSSLKDKVEDIDQARKAYESALFLAPTEAKYHLSLAWSLHRLSGLNYLNRRTSLSGAQMERAYRHYRLALKLDPSDRYINDFVRRSAPGALR